MNDKTKIILARMSFGFGILITSMVTGKDGALIASALVLLGVPLEQTVKETPQKA